MTKIYTTNSIKHMTPEQLDVLAGELRDEIITTVSRNGGHLSSNLGVVELTLAIHYVFNLPEDKLVFDVGHQAYVHKMLTGRREAFSTLRRFGGLSGFPNVDESEYDCFTAGHASTAISAALGLARARDLTDAAYEVVAVVGDGALSGGMCYEALNDAGQSNTHMIVILNDNKMSISRNVGAMSRYLTHLRQSRMYSAVKRGIRRGLEKIPIIGTPVFRFIERIKNALKTLLLDESFFSSLGFEYIGPVDGHDIRRLIKVLEKSRNSTKPMLIHVVTQKGKGYKPAEDQPDMYHGIAPFFVDSGLPKKDDGSNISCGSVVGKTLVQFANEDKRICAVTAAMETGTGLESFHEAHPERFFDVGIAEEHAVVMAGGLAAGGLRPYVAIYSTFLQRAFDQLLIDICRNSLPVVFLLDRAGLVGADGATHQGVFDSSYLAMMPNMMIACPRDIQELQRMLSMSRSISQPLAIRYPRSLPKLIPMDGEQEDKIIEPGTWQFLRSGGDVSLIAHGRMISEALAARKLLESKGIACAVIDARFLKPIDEDVLRRAIETTELIVVIEDNIISGGLESAICAFMRKANLTKPMICLGAPDSFIEQGSIDKQLEICGLTSGQIAEAVLQIQQYGFDNHEKTAC